MNKPIKEVTELAHSILKKLGYSEFQSEYIVENFLEAELMGKKSHGLIRLQLLHKKIGEGVIAVLDEDLSILKESPVSLLMDAKGMTNFFAVPRALELGLKKTKKSGMCAVAITNGAHASGAVGLYAKKATDEDLVFIGFTNSMAYLNPYGTAEKLWGTNPFTVGIPSNDIPVIFDSSSGKISVGDMLVARSEGKPIREGAALDSEGHFTTDPVQGLIGGLVPFENHKGSGMAFIVELMAGVLGKAKVGKIYDRGWGTFMILIDPTIFRDIHELKNEVDEAILELKNAKKLDGVQEVFFPGEQSQRKRKQQLDVGEIEVSEQVWEELQNLL